ncbi:Mrp/NBP35 family ATP-binding protein [Schlesneria paludicola]|uniref:Mrp/NBP35 family ATP-binding protein n=1 Tax=Schlesneria paludicola TaxID=360056 RepID=UPI00029B31A3|nr:Mrp/NBP35 family ATP-binding protein [Schlesneria paludicola]
MVSDAQLTQTIQSLKDPEIGRNFGELEMLKGVRRSGEVVSVQIELPTPAYPGRERISGAISAAVKQSDPGVGQVDVEFSAVVRGAMSGGSFGLRAKNVIAVGSGKGGVGKSTVATTLAYGLKTLGCQVGLMDADVYGPSVPHMIGSTERPSAVKVMTKSGEEIERIQPVSSDGLKVISMGYFLKPDQAVIWRGPLLHRAITQFLKDTDWGELDYLIIDLPPGTGDISLTLSQTLGLAGAVVVCTPQQVALLDAVKAISMFNQVKIPVLGIVENMTGEIFGRGGAKSKAEELHIPFLGELPIDAGIRIRGDAGQISSLFSEENPSRKPLLHICEQVAMQIAKQLLVAPKMPTLEIL